MANTGFIKDTKIIIPFGRSSNIITMKNTYCVRVYLHDIGYFTCGENQLILCDEEFIEAIDCEGRIINGIEVDRVELCGRHNTYDITIDNDDHAYSILVNGHEIIVHNLPVITSDGGGHGTRYYKYIPYEETVTRTVTKTHIVKKQPNVDQSNLVMLGGAFEEIGEEDEVIGGGSQKVG